MDRGAEVAGTGMVEVAGVAGVARTRSDCESEVGRDGSVVVEARNSMRLFAQSTRGLCWRNQHNPITAETLGSRGVTRKLTGKTLSGAK